MRLSVAAAAAVLALAHPAAAQRLDVHAQPPRPALPAGSDTADAHAYFALGTQSLARDPGTAASAFYWASRLHPGWADALYGRRVALLLAMPQERYRRYVEGVRSVTRNPDVAAVDSLHLRALTLDPFLYRRHDQLMLREYWQALMAEYFRRAGEQPNPALVNDWMNGFMRDMDEQGKGSVAYANGNFAEAAQWLERAVRTAGRRRSRVRADLARALEMSGKHDQAAAAMQLAIADLRAQDQRDVVFVYESKALLEHSVATAQERMGDVAAARQSYGRALQEDLAFYPAHVRLGKLALAAGDTAAAVSEMELAVQIAPADGALRYEYATLLADARRFPQAVEHLQRAVELEPHFAAPYLLLGRIYDASGMRTEAAEALSGFAAHAARGDPALAWARQRAGELQAALQAERGGTR